MSKKKSMRYGSHQYYVEKKKALIKQEAELSYKLDGSMSDLTNEPDFDEIDIATEGIK